MVEIKILGSGCAKCMKLTENAETAAKSLGLNYSIGKITDRAAIVESGVMMTPALMVDGKIVSSGRVPSPEEIKPLLR
jgi:small redox-active disulfide protein 2